MVGQFVFTVDYTLLIWGMSRVALNFDTFSNIKNTFFKLFQTFSSKEKL